MRKSIKGLRKDDKGMKDVTKVLTQRTRRQVASLTPVVVEMAS